jgi:hypothetical protein
MKFSDTQLVILNTARQRADRRVLPLPANLKGGAAGKVITSLIAKGLIEEVQAELGDPVFRVAEDDRRLTLVLTPRAFEALGIEQEEGPDPATGAAQAPSATPVDVGRRSANSKAAAGPVLRAPRTREGTKQAILIDMLRAPDGATIEEIMAATGWLSHTVRGTIAGALKKKLGLTVTSEKTEDRGRVYRIQD